MSNGQDAQQYSAKLMNALKLLRSHCALRREMKPNTIVDSREERFTFADFAAY